MADKIYAITAKKVVFTDEVSFMFMFKAEMPKD